MRFDDWVLLQSQSDIVRNQNIGVRLGIVFSFLIAVLIGIGWLGLNRMGRIHGDMEKIVKNRWLKVQLAREALNYSALNSRITMEIFLLREQDEIAPLLAHRTENSQKISDLLKVVETRVARVTEDATKSAARMTEIAAALRKDADAAGGAAKHE